MSISIKTYNQLLGAMIRKVLPNTPLNDINDGSVLLTLLEAAATIDLDNNTSLLSILELLSIDAVKNNDLDSRAGDFGLNRFIAQRASGAVTIQDSSIAKRSTGLYALKPAPITGSTTIYVNDASLWASSGELFLGRGTPQFEGPIAYTSITNNTSFFTITLSSALKKDHLISDVVLDKQGQPDQLISAGTSIHIPSNNQSPQVDFTILRDTVLPAGEDTVTNVHIMAVKAGSQGNAGIGTITRFGSIPFQGAVVTNTSALTDGRDVESDNDLRERLKSYANTLARGTKDSILAAIIGIADTDENKQVASAVVSEPPKLGDPSIIYLDDGRGFQPSYAGQSVDTLLAVATGNEEFLQLSNYPLPRPQVVNTTDGPLSLVDGSTFSVYVDGVESSVVLQASQFRNMAAATLSEIVIAINDADANPDAAFRCRLDQDSSRLLIYPSNSSAETVQVRPLSVGEDEALYANSVLRFPTTIASYIRLYRNNELLKEQDRAGSLTSLTFTDWGLAHSATYDLKVAVDGTPAQSHTFTAADFGGKDLFVTDLADWVAAFNLSFAGITTTATSSNALLISSNRIGSSSILDMVGGSLRSKMFGDLPTYSVGQDSDFQLNRQTGNLRITSGIAAGDSIAAGAADTKGSITSTPTITGAYDLSTIDSRPSTAVMVVDSDAVVSRPINLAVGGSLAVSCPADGILRITSDSVNTFAGVQPHDTMFISKRTSADWFPSPVGPTGTPAPNTFYLYSNLFRVVAKGEHDPASVSTTAYVDVAAAVSATGLTGSTIMTVQAMDDIQVFAAETYPQLFLGSDFTTPNQVKLQEIVAETPLRVANVKSSIFKTSSVRTSSTTETGGSFAVPVAMAGTVSLLEGHTGSQLGNQSHMASKVFSSDAVPFFKRTQPLSDSILDHYAIGDISGVIEENAVPSTDFTSDLFSEMLRSYAVFNTATKENDIVAFTGGANKGHFRSIRELPAGYNGGTQQALPRSVFNHVVGDELTIMKTVSFSPDDNIVFILDKSAVDKTIVVPMARTGRVRTIVPPTNNSFSAYDQDNEPGIGFDSLSTWGTELNGTDFKDYAAWFRARNWYTSEDGVTSMVVRAKEYGPAGENLRFRLEYPARADQTAKITHTNTPAGTEVKCFFGSGGTRSIGTITGFDVEASPGYTGATGYYRYTFAGSPNLNQVAIGDVISIANNSGVSPENRGTFRVLGKSIPDSWIDVYNTNATPTTGGVAEATSVTCGSEVLGTAAYRDINAVGDTAAPGSLATWSFNVTDENVGSVPSSHTMTTVVTTQNFGSGSWDVTRDAEEYFRGTGVPGYYFVLYDADNIPWVFWFRFFGEIQPVVTGVPSNRYVMIMTGTIPYGLPGEVALAIDTAIQAYASVSIHSSHSGATVSIQYVGGMIAFPPDMVTGSPGLIPNAAWSETSLTQKYFSVYDAGGKTTFFYDVNTLGWPAPSTGAYRYVRIPIPQSQTANAIATTTRDAINADAHFTSTVTGGNILHIADIVTGIRTTGDVGNSGFTSYSFASGQTTLASKYFTLNDDAGIAAFWYRVGGTGGTGIAPVGYTGSNRTVQVDVSPGDTASLVASKTATAINADSKFDASPSSISVGAIAVTPGTRIIGGIGGALNTSGFSAFSFVNGTGGTMSGTFFVLYDDVGKVAFWYDVNNSGTVSQPLVPGARFVKIASVISGDTAATVALRTAAHIDADAKFQAFTSGTNVIRVNNSFTGTVAADILYPLSTGFTETFVNGTMGESMDGRYFTVPDADGTVAVWYNVSGGTLEPFHGADRSIRVSAPASWSTVGATAGAVADLTATAITDPTKWVITHTAGNAGITITDADVGGRTHATDGTLDGTAGASTFIVSTGAVGANGSAEVVISGSTNLDVFPLTGTDVANITTTINQSPVVTAVAVGLLGGSIGRATRDETSSVGYGHDPDPTSGENEYIGLYDSVSWVKSFQNADPNFTLKTSFVLQSYPSAYNMGTVPDPDSSDLGEQFKLMPVTTNNILHHFTQKALSQLAIVSDIELANAFKRVQIKSKKLGSEGAVEIVGGRANAAEFSILDDAQEITVDGNTMIEMKIPAFPNTLNVGDYVSVKNINETKRKLNLTIFDEMQIEQAAEAIKYEFKSKVTTTTGSFTIVDQSADYGRDPGIIWRWTSVTNPTFFEHVNAGDTVMTHTSNASWPVGNRSRVLGSTVGFPIVAVDSSQSWIDVVNPHGSAMGTQSIATGTLNVVPSASIKWELAHIVGSTRYRIEKLGFNDLFKVRRVSGQSPLFAQCGVAVDDMVVIGSTVSATPTFKNSSNAGIFTVQAVTDDYIIIQNPSGVEDLDYTRSFSAANWTASSDTVTFAYGATGLSIGDWVKKEEDTADKYAQIIGLTGSTGSTELTLGRVYEGISSSSSTLVAFDTVNDVNVGVPLMDLDDIQVYNADSVRIGDTLFVDDIVDADWFKPQNAGTWAIKDIGSAAQGGEYGEYLPYIQINNVTGTDVDQTAIKMSVSLNGFAVLEGANNRTISIKEVRHTAIDELNPDQRVVYLTSPRLAYKFTRSNGTKISALNKLNYDVGVVTGIDGYEYYTGLMRKVQRTIDGFEPDSVTYPGRRAIGGAIELLPPLIKRVVLSLSVTTNEGVNLNEIGDDIISTIMRYVNGLGVGKDVIMSEIIAQVMRVRGVATAVFTTPTPSTTRITIDDTSKAFIELSDISLS